MPVLTVIAGPNGSGKSTLTSALSQQGIMFGEYLNADDIARELGASSEEHSRQAQLLVREKREAALKERRSHAFETVMSHNSHIEFMHRAAECGFEVRLFFVATEDPVLNVDRVANRVLHGGHDVPVDRIVSRYHRCLANLPLAIDVAHETLVFDNSRADSPLRQIAWAIGEGRIVFSATPEAPVWWQEVESDLVRRWGWEQIPE